MSIRGFHIIWLKVHVEKARTIRFNIPIPMYMLEELLDGTLDLIKLLCFFTRNQAIRSHTSSVNLLVGKELLQMTAKLIDSLTEEGPYNLVDVEVDKVKVSIKIR
ncbi:hypothetical protein [Anaeromicropila herbilytica]|nr:hypothetical protein [Anaeromicropila herbilytica]